MYRHEIFTRRELVLYPDKLLLMCSGVSVEMLEIIINRRIEEVIIWENFIVILKIIIWYQHTIATAVIYQRFLENMGSLKK
jgi:hypothetical protein